MRGTHTLLMVATVMVGMLAPAGCGSAGGARAPSAIVLPSSADDAAREQTADQQVRQVLDRLGFGARPGEAERVRVMGVDRWIARQLEPERIDDAATDRFVTERFPTITRSPAELVAQYPPPGQLIRQRRRGLGRAGERARTPDVGSGRAGVALSAADSARRREAARASRHIVGDAQGAKLARAVMSDRQLQEVMIDFWENHFNVFAGKGPERYLLASYERDAIRPRALGRFRDLLGAVARSPAMLFYLDNWESRANRINENYGRELLELHTVGVDGGYGQPDVIAVARAFTGWTVDAPRRGGGFVFRPGMHDRAPKVVLGHTLPPGRGIEDGEQVLDILARHPSTARFIATKLVRRFVSDTPPPALVDRAAATFARTDGDIRQVLATIVYSAEFFSRAAYRAKVKSPYELVVSALRAVGAPPDGTPRTAQVVARLGEPLFGHQAPDGYPQTGDAWINTGSILERINFGLAMATGRVPGVTLGTWAPLARLTSAPRAAQVDGVIQEILGGEASPDTRRVLESGSNPLLVGARDTSDGGTARRARPATELANLVGLALGSPEFQRH